jgi:1,4-alpha-glucan branching enzyme
VLGHVVGRATIAGATNLKEKLEELAAEVMGWPAGEVHLQDRCERRQQQHDGADGDDRQNSVLAFLRFGDEAAAPVLVVCNMTPVPRVGYAIGVPRAGYWRELLNTDAATYGGSNMGNSGGVQTVPVQRHGEAQSLELTLPPLATIYLRYGN